MSRILVVDDTRNIRKMVILALQQAGHEVRGAIDGRQGLFDFGSGNQWDLMLVDQRMPGLQGREVILKARQRDPMARIIMMTAFASSELALEVLQGGARDFLRKPFSIEVLRATVAAALAAPKHRIEISESQDNSPVETQNEAAKAPRISWRVNGYGFWPLEGDPVPPVGFDAGRLFQVRKPYGELIQCFVGITPHIREQMQKREERYLPGQDAALESLCGEALMNFIWERAETPPPVLPVYEFPVKYLEGQRVNVAWGPLGAG